MVAVVKSLLLGLIDLRDARQRVLHATLLATLLISLFGLPASAVTLYVKPSGDDTASGLSWVAAKKSVTAALIDALSGDEVWVAAGTYNERVTLKDGVGLYGGFAGTEMLLSERDWRSNLSVLDGEAAGTVVTIEQGATPNTVLEGFTIRNGNAAVGGGLYCWLASPTIRRCVFEGNVASSKGGGAYCGYSSSRISQCVFRDNNAPNGGGIYVIPGSSLSSAPLSVYGCVFLRNTAGADGGALFVATNATSKLELVNCTLVENTSVYDGGGIYMPGGNLLLVNNIIAFNSAGVYASGNVVVRSNNVYGNTGFRDYRYMTNPTGTNGNISRDPIFANRAAGDLHIRTTSPCVDTGDSGYTDTLVEDIDGEERVYGASVDMGTDEVQEPPVHLLSLSLSPVTIVGGVTNSTGTVTLDGVAPEGGAVVALSSSSPRAATVPTSVTVPAGQNTASFTVTSQPVSTSDSTYIKASLGVVKKSVFLQVMAFVSITSFSPASGPVGTQVTISGTGLSGTTVVRFNGKPASSFKLVSYTRITTIVPAGATTGKVSVTTPGGIASSIDDFRVLELSSLSLSPTSVTGGSGGVTGIVTLSGAASTGGVVVTLSSSNAAAAAVPASVTVLEGQSQATFPITTDAVSATTTVTISAACSEVTRSAALTVNPEHTGYVSRDIALAPDGSLRILQAKEAFVRIARVTGSSVQPGAAVPVPAGWSPVAVAVGPDLKTRLLWSGPGGAVSVMTFTASGARESYQVVGTYAGVLSRDIAVAGDGSIRILQASASLVRILKIAGTSLQYGTAVSVPTGWSPVAIAAGPDNKTRLLWSGPSGAASVMTFTVAGVRESYQPLGVYAGVASIDIAVAADNSVRILQVSSALARILKVTGSSLQYGPVLTIPAGWMPVAIASGSDDKTRLLWGCGDGKLGVMTTNASGAREAYVAMGPF